MPLLMAGANNGSVQITLCSTRIWNSWEESNGEPMIVREGCPGEEHVTVVCVQRGVKKDIKAVGTLGLAWGYGAFEVCRCPRWVMIVMRWERC